MRSTLTFAFHGSHRGSADDCLVVRDALKQQQTLAPSQSLDCLDGRARRGAVPTPVVLRFRGCDAKLGHSLHFLQNIAANSTPSIYRFTTSLSDAELLRNCHDSLMEAPPRRQNRSCDRCRRSKRRCILETSHNEQCRNCARLGDKCTFTLAATIAAKKRQRSFHNAGPDLVEPAAHIEVDVDAAFANATERTVSLSFDSSSPVLQGSFDNIWSPPSIFSVPFCFENLFSELVDGPPGIENVFEPEEAMHLSLSNDDEFTVSSHGLSTDGSQMMHLLDSRDEVLSSTASTNTPTSLLTSTLDSSITNQYLDKFFHALTTVLYHRYLSPRANIAARVPTYEILPNDASDKLLGPPNDSVLGQSTLHLQASRTEDQVSNSNDIVKVSVVGAARFLDNFALLYGNHRARGERQRDEEMLRLVVQAIALNHSPFSDRGDQQTGDQSKLVADAWFRAYSSLVESISRRSFVLIYAAFTFDLASAVPELVTAEHPDIDTTLLLDHALRQLDHLSRLLRDFCSCLPEKSSYRRRLQTCLRIMMWHGYVRDTVCSFRRYRQCILEDIPLSSMSKSMRYSGNSIPFKYR